MKIKKTVGLYMNNIILYNISEKTEKTAVKAPDRSKSSIFSWSSILSIKSPVSFESKYEIGNWDNCLINVETNDIFIFILKNINTHSLITSDTLDVIYIKIYEIESNVKSSKLLSFIASSTIAWIIKGKLNSKVLNIKIKRINQ